MLGKPWSMFFQHFCPPGAPTHARAWCQKDGHRKSYSFARPWGNWICRIRRAISKLQSQRHKVTNTQTCMHKHCSTRQALHYLRFKVHCFSINHGVIEEIVFRSAKVTLFLINCLSGLPFVDFGVGIIISKTRIVHNLAWLVFQTFKSDSVFSTDTTKTTTTTTKKHVFEHSRVSLTFCDPLWRDSCRRLLTAWQLAFDIWWVNQHQIARLPHPNTFCRFLRLCNTKRSLHRDHCPRSFWTWCNFSLFPPLENEYLWPRTNTCYTCLCQSSQKYKFTFSAQVSLGKLVPPFSNFPILRLWRSRSPRTQIPSSAVTTWAPVGSTDKPPKSLCWNPRLLQVVKGSRVDWVAFMVWGLKRGSCLGQSMIKWWRVSKAFELQVTIPRNNTYNYLITILQISYSWLGLLIWLVEAPIPADSRSVPRSRRNHSSQSNVPKPSRNGPISS